MYSNPFPTVTSTELTPGTTAALGTKLNEGSVNLPGIALKFVIL